MKKIFKKQYLILASFCFFVFVFALASFFIWIIAKSDFIDLQTGGLSSSLLIKDFFAFLAWLCFIPFLIFFIKRYNQKYHR